MNKIIHLAVFALGIGFASAQISIADKAAQATSQVKTTTEVANTAVSSVPSVSDLTSKEGIKTAVKAEAQKKISELKDKAATKINEKVKNTTGLSNVLPTSASATTNNPAATTMPTTTAVVPAAVNLPTSKEEIKNAATNKAAELKDKATTKVKDKVNSSVDKLINK